MKEALATKMRKYLDSGFYGIYNAEGGTRTPLFL